MHADSLGNVLQGQRLQRRQALGQEVCLLPDNLAGDLQRCAVALVKRAAKPAGRSDRLVDKGVSGLCRLAATGLADLRGILPR